MFSSQSWALSSSYNRRYERNKLSLPALFHHYPSFNAVAFYGKKKIIIIITGSLRPGEDKGFTIVPRLRLATRASDICSRPQTGRRDREGGRWAAIGGGHMRASRVRMRGPGFI